MDLYVFGDIKDEKTNLIPDFARAVELLKMLARGPREFDLIMCSDSPESIEAAASGPVKHLGYDVAAVSADFWSIVDDFTLADWGLPFRSRLNAFGLFPSREDAEQYLKEYRARKEADSDAPFEVVFVAHVEADDWPVASSS